MGTRRIACRILCLPCYGKFVDDKDMRTSDPPVVAYTEMDRTFGLLTDPHVGAMDLPSALLTFVSVYFL